MVKQFMPGDLKKLGVPLSGSNADSSIVPDSNVAIVQPDNKPILTQENGNLSILVSQQWIGKDAAVEIFTDNKYRRGFVITNNDATTVYIGTTDDVSALKKVGTPIYTKSSFSSALYQGRLYVVADDAAGIAYLDIRIWEEQI